jgi:hypothetical protein
VATAAISSEWMKALLPSPVEERTRPSFLMEVAADCGFASLVPCADGESLLDVHGREFDQMANACGPCDVCCEFVSDWDLRAAVDEEEPVDPFDCFPQGFCVGEIAKTYIDAIAEAGLCLVGIAGKDSWAIAALNEKVDYP